MSLRKARNAALVLLLAACAVMVVVACSVFTSRSTITVGFVYDNEETMPYSYNFYLAQEALQEKYGDGVKVFMYSNVQEEKIRIPIQKLADRGCDIIFTNSYGNVLPLAKEFPSIQFCQVSDKAYDAEEAEPNYHTFKGEIYQGRYASGVVAGIKLKQMIEERSITPQEALVGFVGAFPYPEVVSGYTAFLLGVRSVVPQATMRVKYTNSWSSYTLEKACASQLLDEGCVVLSEHTDTIGPAIACEEYYARDVWHVGYNVGMTDVAPYTTLVSTHIDWTPYVLGAVEAVAGGRRIEDVVQGNVHESNDMSGGVADGWVKLTELNERLMPSGSKEKVDKVMEALARDEVEVFVGNYTGVNPEDPTDVIDLRKGFKENATSSIPSFCYVLDDVVTVDP